MEPLGRGMSTLQQFLTPRMLCAPDPQGCQPLWWGSIIAPHWISARLGAYGLMHGEEGGCYVEKRGVTGRLSVPREENMRAREAVGCGSYEVWLVF
jgi:hypothetical protein